MRNVVWANFSRLQLHSHRNAWYIPTGMHGPTCIFLANLTPLLALAARFESVDAQLRVPAGELEWLPGFQIKGPVEYSLHDMPPGISVEALLASWAHQAAGVEKVKCTGLTQNSRVDPAV